MGEKRGEGIECGGEEGECGERDIVRVREKE